jgi:hypothetical protein
MVAGLAREFHLPRQPRFHPSLHLRSSSLLSVAGSNHDERSTRDVGYFTRAFGRNARAIPGRAHG